MAVRICAFIGAITLVALIDGAIGGVAAATWGDAWGHRLDDLVQFAIAATAIWQWIADRLPNTAEVTA